MKNIYIILPFLLVTFTFLGQTPGTFFGSNQILNGGKFATTTSEIKNNNVKGSPFLFKNFKNDGVLCLTSGELYNIKNININLDKGYFVSELGKDSVFIFNNVKTLEIKAKTYMQNNNSIYEILQSGDKLSFLKKNHKILKRQVQNKLTAEVVKWKLKENYYIQIAGDFNEINLRKKDFFKFIKKDKLELLKKHIKANKLSSKKEKDLIEIFRYYNGM